MKKLLCVFLCLVLVSGLSACAPSYFERTVGVFGGKIEMSVEIWGKGASAAYNEMIDTVNEIDRQINVNDPRTISDMVRFNRAAAGEAVQIGYYAFYLLEKAKELYAQTGGAFNAAAYPLVYLWGMDALNYSAAEFVLPPSFTSEDEIQPVEKPAALEIERVKAYCDLDKLTLTDAGNGTYYAEKEIDGLMVDLGGIAKGYAADLCREICARRGILSARINISGDLVLHGRFFYNSNKGKNWKVLIKTPIFFGLGGYACAFSVTGDTGCATSGDYERFRAFADGGKNVYVPHIMDTVSGLPYSVEYDGVTYSNKSDRVVSCTVITPKSMYADAYATAACVMGLEDAVDFLTEAGLKAVLFTADKQMAVTGGVSFTDTDEFNKYKEYSVYNG